MPLPTSLRCGPAGWSYPHWNGCVYAKSRPRGFHPLELMAALFDTVEINTSFYRPLRPEVTHVWARKVEFNQQFLFTAKLNQRFTHDRVLDRDEVTQFKEGLWPLHHARRLGAVLMQFPWSFRFTSENREWFIQLRRAFHEFPLVAEMRHESWSVEEALGTFIDYRVGFCNIDQPEYTRAMPPAAFLTSPVGYVRLHGRNPANSLGAYSPETARVQQHDYLYSRVELSEWEARVRRLNRNAAATFVIWNNDIAGKSVVNALQMSVALGDTQRVAPASLIARYRAELTGFRSLVAEQAYLFPAA